MKRFQCEEERIIEICIVAMTLFAIAMMFCSCDSGSGDADQEPLGWSDEYTIVGIYPGFKYEDPAGTILTIVTDTGELYAITDRTAIQSQWQSCSVHNDDVSAIHVGNRASIRGFTVVPDANRQSIEAANVTVYNPDCRHEETYEYTIEVSGTPTPGA